MKTSPKGSHCLECKNTHEKCGDSKSCSRWRVSYDVCIVFGTRPWKPGFVGAGVRR